MPNGELVRHAAVQESVPKNQRERHPKDEHQNADGFCRGAALREEFHVPGSKDINPEKHKKRECCNDKKILAHDTNSS